jgi:1-acyl-sn-glycerol-3-phosphate acyltransferase
MIRYLCSLLFRFWGWTYKSDIPDDLKVYVAVGAPHTSNWDFVTAMTIMRHSKVRSKFLIKSSWMKFPMKYILAPLGAVAVDREAIQSGEVKSSTDTLSELFDTGEKTALWIAPEGTRSFRDKWKTGFYYIALKANLPIVLAYADWKTKTAGLGKVIYPTGDKEKDLREIMNFYKEMQGKIPEKFSVDTRYL